MPALPRRFVPLTGPRFGGVSFRGRSTSDLQSTAFSGGPTQARFVRNVFRKLLALDFHTSLEIFGNITHAGVHLRECRDAEGHDDRCQNNPVNSYRACLGSQEPLVAGCHSRMTAEGVEEEKHLNWPLTYYQEKRAVLFETGCADGSRNPVTRSGPKRSGVGEIRHISPTLTGKRQSGAAKATCKAATRKNGRYSYMVMATQKLLSTGACRFSIRDR